jgi:hypothetical protein
MGFFDSISETVSNLTGGLGDQVSGAVEDATSQIPGADQIQEVTDQVSEQATQVQDTILPGDQSSEQ